MATPIAAAPAMVNLPTWTLLSKCSIISPKLRPIIAPMHSVKPIGPPAVGMIEMISKGAFTITHMIMVTKSSSKVRLTRIRFLEKLLGCFLNGTSLKR